MSGEYNKAWVALIMAALIIIDDWTGWEITGLINEKTVITILAILGPVFVWLVPNRVPRWSSDDSPELLPPQKSSTS